MRDLYLPFFALSLLIGCRPAHNSEGDSDVETVFFANSQLRSNKVSVCWEFTSLSTSQFRSAFQSTVAKAFARTKLRFTGWGKCPANEGSPDFRILIYDDKGSAGDSDFKKMKASLASLNGSLMAYPGHPSVRIGKPQEKGWILGKKAAIILNTTFVDSVPEVAAIYHRQSAKGKYNLALSSSLHEFGHAIGLRHEDAHSQNKCAAFDENPKPGDIQIGPWNPTSFMERCFYRNFDYAQGIVWPNELDIKGINTRYR